MIAALLGAMIGFQLAWGPILWGLIGAVAGTLLGLGLRMAKAASETRRQNAGKSPGVIVIIRCEAGEAEMAQELLWTNAAMGVSKLNI